MKNYKYFLLLISFIAFNIILAQGQSTQCSTWSPVKYNTQSIPCGYYNTLQINFVKSNLFVNTNVTSNPWGAALIMAQNGTMGTFVDNNNIMYDILAANIVSPVSNPDEQNPTTEFQFYASSSDGSLWIVISIFAGPADNPWKQDPTKMFSSYTRETNNVTVDLSDLNWRLMNNVNFVTYNAPFPYQNSSGTCTTVTWYLYSPIIWMNSADLNALSVYTNQSSGSIKKIDSSTASRMCWGGYYQLTIPFNYGLWFAIVITTLFFIFTLSFENIPIEDEDYQTNPWTHHPIYSIMKVGNNIFTRKSRSALLWINIVNICMFTAIFYAQIGYNDNKANIFVFGLAGCLVSIGTTYIHGYFLRRYYVCKALFIEKDEEIYDDQAQRYLFIFYFWVFLWMWGGNVIFIWQMSYLHGETDITLSNYWVASFFIALGLDWLVFDPICAVLAKSGLKNIFKIKGYIYDEICHNSYKKQKKLY